MSSGYSKAFYDEMKDTNLISARIVSPIIMDLVNPASVVDVGCGTGIWLKAFRELGVSTILGFDGKWVEKKMLVIPEECFTSQDLEKPFRTPKADLVLCLEVAEHLDEDASSSLIQTLTQVAPVVLFSAAIPFQGGARHINEQWPEYWEKKFLVHGFIPVDCIRRRVWNDEGVSFFYAQNMLIYVKKERLSEYLLLAEEVKAGNGRALPLVHPHMYIYYAERWKSIVPYISKLPVPILHGAKRLLNLFRRKNKRR